jgi:hypothetical protein
METHEDKFFLMNDTMDAFIDEDGEETDDISDAISSDERIVVENTAQELRSLYPDVGDFAIVQLVRRSA